MRAGNPPTTMYPASIHTNEHNYSFIYSNNVPRMDSNRPMYTRSRYTQAPIWAGKFVSGIPPFIHTNERNSCYIYSNNVPRMDSNTPIHAASTRHVSPLLKISGDFKNYAQLRPYTTNSGPLSHHIHLNQRLYGKFKYLQVAMCLYEGRVHVL